VALIVSHVALQHVPSSTLFKQIGWSDAAHEWHFTLAGEATHSPLSQSVLSSVAHVPCSATLQHAALSLTSSQPVLTAQSVSEASMIVSLSHAMRL
jgi:hypothetical protein